METFFNFFQIVSLGIFLSLVIGNSIYLRRRFKVNTLKLGIKGKNHIIELITFLIVTTWTLLLLFYCLNSSFGTFSGIKSLMLFKIIYLRFFGVILILIAFTIFILALKDLGISWRLGIDEMTPGGLVTRGIYSIIRHPIYLFFDLYFIGTFLINTDLIFLIFSVVLVAIMHYQILLEEAFLREKYPQGYVRYSKATGRYFTFSRLRGLFSQKRYSKEDGIV